ncbi:MAG: TraM recognition domain-containing protein [Oligoflexia bacterium]|nr:TraM recognition domain-containing protein [Oligoflexia bacterium]
MKKRKVAVEKREREKAILAPAPGSVYCGKTKEGEEVHIKPRQRAMHTQVIGTTNAGKTESVILPWAIQDIEQGRGLILIDGKADRSLLDKLWTYTVKSGREKDFRLFSLSHIEESHQFNPLIGGTAEEISERVFNSFEFENPYYRSLQFEIFSQVMRVFEAAKFVPTFTRVHEVITKPNRLQAIARELEDSSLREWSEYFAALSISERAQRTSGLTAALSHFAFGKSACLFNTEKPGITLEDALNQNLIVYFQLPVLLSPFLGKASGRMILQCLQSAVANRHRSADKSPQFFSVFLDDFSEYLYPGFVSVLNKSRSANVGVVFAHQALGDIKTMGDAIANSILTNANIKVFMRGNDPESAEYFSKVIGTVKAIKYTERRKKVLWKEEATGDTSAREVDEFVIHPNHFKRELGVGEAVMIIPHEAGSRAIEIKFRRYGDLPPSEIPVVPKTNRESAGLKVNIAA